jgi:imidazole glycerol-phosphate synthase subunit HisH
MKRKKPIVAVVDYGMGNLRSVQKALEHVGADARVTDSVKDLERADGIVLPGVGAFGQAVRRLRSKGLWNPIQRSLKADKPFFGICLGYQLLFDKSAEAPGVRGLGFFKGPVVKFRFPKTAGRKVPHMGWNTLAVKQGTRTSILRGIGPQDHFYFVHSFFPVPTDRSLVTATTAYGKAFASVVSRDRVFACQFHPEKSGRHGQQLLKNFVRGLR